MCLSVANSVEWGSGLSSVVLVVHTRWPPDRSYLTLPHGGAIEALTGDCVMPCSPGRPDSALQRCV